MHLLSTYSAFLMIANLHFMLVNLQLDHFSFDLLFFTDIIISPYLTLMGEYSLSDIMRRGIGIESSMIYALTETKPIIGVSISYLLCMLVSPVSFIIQLEKMEK